MHSGRRSETRVFNVEVSGLFLTLYNGEIFKYTDRFISFSHKAGKQWMQAHHYIYKPNDMRPSTAEALFYMVVKMAEFQQTQDTAG